MKILQINKFYYPHVGGVESHVRALSIGLKKKASVHVLCANEAPRAKKDLVDGIEVTRLASVQWGSSAPIAPAFLWKLPDKDFDIHHVHFPSGLPEIALAFKARKVDGALIVTYHSDIVRQKRLERIFRPFAVKLLKAANRVVVGSPNLVDNSPLLSSVRGKCEVVPFGVDPGEFSRNGLIAEKAAKIRATYGDRLVFFLGRLIYYKGIEYLVRAMASVNGVLLVGGTGPLESKLKALAAEAGVSSKVVFLGRIPKSDRSAYYAACDVFVLPSVAPSEAYGLSQVEAHMCGKPVVSTSLPTGVPFVNLDGETGFIVPPRDEVNLARAINRLLDDDVLRREMGERARMRALSEFTVERMVDRTYGIYAAALEEVGR